MKPQSDLLAFVLDDDPVFLQLISAVLKKYGFRCEAFSTSKALLQKLKLTQPSLCFLDLNVEHSASTLEVLKVIRSSIDPLMPVIVVSGDKDQGSIAHALEAGAQDYLIKPLEREILVSKLLRFAKSRELEDAAMGFATAPALDLSVDLVVSGRCVEIDEFGIKVQGPNLFGKGLVVSIASPFLQSVVGRSQPILLTAVSNWVEDHRGLYGAYLEFDSTDTELLVKVRTWLLQKEKNAS
jgi:CheY-like chemotaxis protein